MSMKPYGGASLRRSANVLASLRRSANSCRSAHVDNRGEDLRVCVCVCWAGEPRRAGATLTSWTQYLPDNRGASEYGYMRREYRGLGLGFNAMKQTGSR